MFKVINGGLLEGSADSRKKFISAEITNTRLMGVVGIFVHWKLLDNETNTEFFQCFYLDAEEYGFDSYEYVVGPDLPETREKAEKLADRLLGGLGGTRVAISERETRSLVQDYVYMNHKNKIPIPDDAEVDFIMRPEVTLDIQERRELMAKQCEEIKGDWQLVNYFIMRCVGHDFEAARYLTSGHVNFLDFRNEAPAVLLRNESEVSGSEFKGGKDHASFSTSVTYRCQSLVEFTGRIEVIISRVTVDGLKVTGFEILTRETISPMEADMLTRRDEYIIICDLLTPPEDFTKESASCTAKAQETAYDKGRLFVLFKPDNDHVKERVFKLYDDVFGSIFITDFGQVIIESFDREVTEVIARDLVKELEEGTIIPAVRYSFDYPVFYEFIKSEFEDFEDFVDVISENRP